MVQSRRAVFAAAAVMAVGAGVFALRGSAAEPRTLGGTPVPGFETASLSTAQFEKLHAALEPKGERWTEIPWETDLQQARTRAAREGKPLFLWIMDGHPLGCT
ncbi:MAG: hypothetical protein ACK47B_25005 [Armatimonadota bacterium]